MKQKLNFWIIIFVKQLDFFIIKIYNVITIAIINEIYICKKIKMEVLETMKKRFLALLTALAVGASTLSAVASAGSAAEDGVEVLSGTYEGSEYFIENMPLGIANSFHLFAFDSIVLKAHCNGNFAAPSVDASQASGTNQNNRPDTGTFPGMSIEVSIATEHLNIQGSTLMTDLLVPMDSLVTDANGNYTITNPISGQVRIDGNLVDMNHTARKNIYHVEEDYIDFASYKKAYGNLSRNISDAQATVTPVFENNRCTIVLADKGMNVINMTGEEFYDAQNGFDIYNAQYENGAYSGDQSCIINVDLAGYNYYTTNSQVTIYRSDDTTVHNKEENVNDGTIVLWNFYDSSSADGLYHGTIRYGKTSLGSVLAPYAHVSADQNVDGNIIANSISTGAQSHRCDFMGPLTIGWEDTTTTTTTTMTTTSETTTTPTTTSQTTTSETTTTPTTTSQTTTSETTTTPTTTSQTTTSETTTTPTTTSQTTTSETTTSATTTSETTTSEVTTTSETTTSEVTTTPTTTTPTETTTTAGDLVGGEGEDVTTTSTTSDDGDTTTTTTVGDLTGGDGDEGDTTTTTGGDLTGGSGDDGDTTTTTTGGNLTGGSDDNGDDDDDDGSLIGGGNDDNPQTGDTVPAIMTVAISALAILASCKKSKKERYF